MSRDNVAVRNAQHFIAAGGVMALQILLARIQAKVSPEARAEVEPILKDLLVTVADGKELPDA